MDTSRCLLTPCPPPDYKNPYVKPRGNIFTQKLDYEMTKEYAEELFSNDAFRTSKNAVGILMFDRFKELVIQCFCPFILEAAQQATKAPMIAYHMLDSIKYKGAWKVHYHLVLEVKCLIHTFIFYYAFEYRDPKNPSAPPFRPQMPPSEMPNKPRPPPIPDVPNLANPYSLSDHKLHIAMNAYHDDIRSVYSELQGITKAKTIVKRTREFFEKESPELERWLKENGFLE